MDASRDKTPKAMNCNDSTCREVLSGYTAIGAVGQLEPLVPGFSGSSLWKVTAAAGAFVLRKHPTDSTTAEQLRFVQEVAIHVGQGGFRQVAKALVATSGECFVSRARDLWQVHPWVSGESLQDARPTPQQVSIAMQTLADWHLAASSLPRPAGSPAVTIPPATTRRQQRLDEVQAQIGRWGNAIDGHLGTAAREAAATVLALFPLVTQQLSEPWLKASRIKSPIQPCIRDIWRDHVLFAADGTVAGLIDLFGLGWDSVATDVARLLGSLAVDDAEIWQTGLNAYHGRRTLSDDERRLVEVYDLVNVAVSGCNWVEWLFVERREFTNVEGAIARLDHFAERMKRRVKIGLVI